MGEYISVEVILTSEGEQEIEKLLVLRGTVIMDAILQSNIYKKHSELHSKNFSFGVFGKERDADYLLSPNDRIEIYRELVQDPKERRKKIIDTNKD